MRHITRRLSKPPDIAGVRQFAGGVAGQAAGLTSTLIIQILQVPLLVTTLGASGYGKYILLIAVPSLAIMSDFGLLAATSTAMLQAVSSGNLRYARRLSQLTSALLMIIGCIVLVGIVVGALLIASEARSLPDWAAAVFLIYGLYGLVCVQTNALEAILRADGRQFFGWTYVAGLRVSEFGVGSAILLFTSSIISFVAAMLAVRVAGTIVLAVLCARKAPWSSRRPTLNGWRESRYLRAPLLASLSQPATNYLYLQGTLLVVGAGLGPTASAQLGTARTLANAIRQGSQVLIMASMPVMSRALAQRDRETLRVTRRLTVGAVLPLIAISSLALVIAGPSVIELWTSGELQVERGLWTLLAVEVAVEVALGVATTPLIAANLHFGYSMIALATAALYVVTAIPASQHSLEAVVILQIIAVLSSVLVAVAFTKKVRSNW